MKQHKIPNGVWPVMLTAFNRDREIDRLGNEALIEFYISHGVTGLFATCGSSEAAQLAPSEMLGLVTHTRTTADERVPVVAGALVQAAPRALAVFIRQVADAGADAVVLTPSLLVEPDEPETALRDRLENILEMTGSIPLGIYEWPSPYHRLLSPEMLGWIAATGRFVFHKDTCCDIEAIADKLRRAQGTPLRFFNANLTTLVPSLELGANGYSGIGANLYPEAYVWLCRHVASQPQAARRLQDLLLSVEGRLCCQYPMSAKTVLARRGVRMPSYCRKSDGELTPAQHQLLRTAWSEFEEGFARIRSQAESPPVTEALPAEEHRHQTVSASTPDGA